MRMTSDRLGTGESTRRPQSGTSPVSRRHSRGGTMAHTTMLDAYPKDLGNIDKDKLAECIAA